ncbi:MAG: protein kinase [Candidatus Zixiibacteriota bacterium]|nr:MAG: protein kinase [candidate division Zixibacteria bacterium]
MAAGESNDDSTRSFVALAKDTAVSHYRIINKIGSGGMGEVYLAQDTDLDRKVAIKFLSAHLCQDEDCRRRFRREAQAAAKLDHANIVTVHEVGEFNDRPYFVMQHIEGQSLRGLFKKEELPFERIIDLSIQICDGLREAHEAGITHRDIKPSNILIDNKGKPKLVDFGLATVKGTDKLTKTGSTMGTEGYMSPEQVEGKQVDQRSDLFSLGVVLYEMITGKRPFTGEYPQALTYAILHETPEPLARYKANVPDGLQQIVDRALEKNVETRYPNAAAMLTDLKRLRRDYSGITTGGRAVLRTLLKPLPIAIISLIVVGIAVAGYFLTDLFSRRPEATTTATSDTQLANSIAVLPFRDLSPDKDQDFFCEGMTDAIIGRLSSIRNLKVISLTSVLRFKSPDRDLKQIGADLGVSTILEGTILKDRDSIRIRAQLINVADDDHLWTDHYDREVKSVFAVQDDISQAIAEVMEVTLLSDDQPNLAARGTENMAAYNAYLQGRYFWRKCAEKHLRKAIEYFRKAIELDPDYALAYSGLVDAWIDLIAYGGLSEQEESDALSESKQAVEKALSLNDRLAEVQASQGNYHRARHSRPDGTESDLEMAKKAYLKAIELNDGYSWAHFWYAMLLQRAYQVDEWERQINIAYQLDPLSPRVLTELGYFYYMMKAEYDKGEEYLNRAVEIEPSYPAPYYWIAFRYIGKEDMENALATADKMAEVSAESNPRPYILKAEIMNRFGRSNDAAKQYERAIEVAPHQGDTYYQYAFFLDNWVGDHKKADPYYRRAAELEHRSWAIHSCYGYCLAELGKYMEALKHFERAYELAPLQGDPNRGQGLVLGYRLGKPREGVPHIKRGLEIQPHNAWYWNDLAYLYSFIGDTDSSLIASDSSIQRIVNAAWNKTHLLHPVWLHYRVEILAHNGLLDSAASCLYRCLDLDTAGVEFPDYIKDLAEIAITRRDYAAADSLCQFLVSREDSLQHRWERYYKKEAPEADSSQHYPRLAYEDSLYRAWGRYYAVRPLLHQGKFREAVECLRKGVESDRAEMGNCGPLREKHYQIGLLFLDYLGEPLAAIKEFQAAETVNQQVDTSGDWSLRLCCLQARAYAAAGQRQKAKTVLDECYENLDTAYTARLLEYYGHAAAIKRSEGDYKKAVELMEKQHERSGYEHQFDVLLALGQAYLDAGRATDAVAALEKAMARYMPPRLERPALSVLGHYYLGRAYHAAGRAGDAVKQYEVFLDIWENADEGLGPVEDANRRLAQLKSGI